MLPGMYLLSAYVTVPSPNAYGVVGVVVVVEDPCSDSSGIMFVSLDPNPNPNPNPTPPPLLETDPVVDAATDPDPDPGCTNGSTNGKQPILAGLSIYLCSK